MDSSLREALLAISLEADEAPFLMPATPEFSSCQVNEMSIIGRLLNPDRQKISNLILDMPRKWQLYNRVRGIALSKDRFQFVFKYHHDLEDTLAKGVQSFNDWTIVLDRWMEKPPPDYLQHILVWVQIRNIPVNHRTVQAITSLGYFAGEVREVVFDPEKAQTQPFARVLVRFNVNNPLRRTKLVTIPSSESTTIFYFYERITKRCFACQRLTHEHEYCPFLLQKKKELAQAGLQPLSGEDNQSPISHFTDRSLLPQDPLFGVLTEEQVGIDKLTGNPIIATEVLDEMRTYLSIAEGEDKLIRIARVKSSIAALEQDPAGQRSMLRLIPPPLVSKDITKGKGVVFDYGHQEQFDHPLPSSKRPDCL